MHESWVLVIIELSNDLRAHRSELGAQFYVVIFKIPKQTKEIQFP